MPPHAVLASPGLHGSHAAAEELAAAAVLSDESENTQQLRSLNPQRPGLWRNPRKRPRNSGGDADGLDNSEVRTPTSSSSIVAAIVSSWMKKRADTFVQAKLVMERISSSQSEEEAIVDRTERANAVVARKRRFLAETPELPRLLIRKVGRDEYVLSHHLSLIPEVHDYLSDLLDGLPPHMRGWHYSVFDVFNL